jgi:transposase
VVFHSPRDRAGEQRAAVISTLIGTAEPNGIDPQAWLAEVIARICNMPISHLPALFPRNWATPEASAKAA